jgi:hypothetical protein
MINRTYFTALVNGRATSRDKYGTYYSMSIPWYSCSLVGRHNGQRVLSSHLPPRFDLIVQFAHLTSVRTDHRTMRNWLHFAFLLFAFLQNIRFSNFVSKQLTMEASRYKQEVHGRLCAGCTSHMHQLHHSQDTAHAHIRNKNVLSRPSHVLHHNMPRCRVRQQ